MIDRSKVRQHYSAQEAAAMEDSMRRHPSGNNKSDLIEDLWKRVYTLTGQDLSLQQLEQCLDLALSSDTNLIEQLYIADLITYEARCNGLTALRVAESDSDPYPKVDRPYKPGKSILGQIRREEWATLSGFAIVIVGTSALRTRIMRRYVPRNRRVAVFFATIVGSLAVGAFNATFREVIGKINASRANYDRDRVIKIGEK